MERKVADRDDVVHRVDDRDGHAALGGASHRTRAPLGEARDGDCASDCARYHHEPLHGCLTTTIAFMNGWGVQWKAYSPGCANVWLHDWPGSIGPESHDPSSAVTVWTSWSSLVQRTVVPGAISRRFGLNVIVRISAAVALLGSGTPLPPVAARCRLPKYLLSVKGIVNSNPPRTRSMPRDAPWSVAVLVFVTWIENECGE